MILKDEYPWLIQEEILDGFDLDLIGFVCRHELEWGDERTCPFNPGCGRKRGEPCPLELKRAKLTSAVDTKQ